MTSSPFNTAHVDTTKLAVVYLRQSSPGQVRDHVIATQEQYRLREIPEARGYPPDRIIIVDEDLGVSGHTIAGRKGMLRVLELLEQGAASCVVVRDVSRLSRDEFNADIGLIARQCYLSGTVIVTPEKVYNPADPSDQLLLGLQGLIAGWDRANIVRRLSHHRRVKQARGVNINGAVPPGYEKVTDVPRGSPEHGKLRITSDSEVRDRITLILRRGFELKGVLAVVRYLQAHNLSVPIWRGEEEQVVAGTDGVTRLVARGRRVIRWVKATRGYVTRILKNPTYAGAIVNSRRTTVLDRASGKRRWSTRRSYEDCVVIRDAHEAYITWEEHHELLTAIARNNRAKVFGKGQALLSGLGLLRCGACGTPMVVAYNNPERQARGRVYRNTPYYYACTRRTAEGRNASCQNPAGPYIDRAAKELIIFALEEIDLDGVRVALEDRRRRTEQTTRLRLREVEILNRRARMLEEAIADAKSPEARTRLVARFEELLAELDAARRALAQPTEPEPVLLSPELLGRLEVLKDPAIAWERFTQRTRKEIIRALAKSVWIYPDLDGYVLVIDWEGGGRAAAKVRTMRRKKIFPVPEEVRALFSGELDTGPLIHSKAARSSTSSPSSLSIFSKPCDNRSKMGRWWSRGPAAPRRFPAVFSSSGPQIPAAAAAQPLKPACARRVSASVTWPGSRVPCSTGSTSTWSFPQSSTPSWLRARLASYRRRSGRGS